MIFYSASLRDQKWYLETFTGDYDEFFWYYYSPSYDISTVLFISNENDLDKVLVDELPRPSNFTDTHPDYRCNFQIFLIQMADTRHIRLNILQK